MKAVLFALAICAVITTQPASAVADHRYVTPVYRYGGYPAYPGTGHCVDPYSYRGAAGAYGSHRPYPGFSYRYANPTVIYHYSFPRVTTGYGFRSDSYPRDYRRYGGVGRGYYGGYGNRR